MAENRVVRVTMKDSDLWKEFEENTTEMVLTKAGRKMFPVVRVSVEGLDPNAMYQVFLEFVQRGANRFTFAKGKWTSGKLPFLPAAEL